MKLALILATLALSAPLARAGEPVAFYDIQKALTTSAEGKKNAADEAADLKAKQAEMAAAQEAAKKADAACAKLHEPAMTIATVNAARPKACVDADATRIHVSELGQRYQQELTQRQQDATARLVARINRVLPVLAKAKRLGAVLPAGGAFYASPALDMTAEVVRRLDAGEGAEPVATKDDEISKLRAELASLQAERVALTKPTPPSVPPAPTAQPIASKGKK